MGAPLGLRAKPNLQLELQTGSHATKDNIKSKMTFYVHQNFKHSIWWCEHQVMSIFVPMAKHPFLSQLHTLRIQVKRGAIFHLNISLDSKFNVLSNPTFRLQFGASMTKLQSINLQQGSSTLGAYSNLSIFTPQLYFCMLNIIYQW